MWRTTYLCKSVMNDESDLWYKLCVYYHAKTELYDRTLTDLRSPYDPTEAYIQSGIERSLSWANARKIRQFVSDMAIGIPEYIKHLNLNANKHHYSAQDWIDIYNKLVADGEMDFIEMEYEKYENIKNALPEHRGYRAKILIVDDLCDIDKEKLKDIIKEKNMVKLHCDRCGEEIKDKYYTINFWEYETHPKSANYSIADACSSSYSRESALEMLNSQKMYCKKCRNEFENFMNSKG